MSTKEYSSPEYFTQELRRHLERYLAGKYGFHNSIRHTRGNNLTLSLCNLTTQIELITKGNHLEARIEVGNNSHRIINKKRIKIIRTKTGRASPKMYLPINQQVIKTLKEASRQ